MTTIYAVLGKMDASYLVLIWISLLVVDLNNSSPEECQNVKDRLQVQLRIMEARAMKQQEMIQHLLMINQQAKNKKSVNMTIFFDFGDEQYTDCSQIFTSGKTESGFYLIKPANSSVLIRVFCDMTEGGGWTVFQRRSDGTQSFDRDWKDYKTGFGDMQSVNGEFWLGNDNLHYLTSQDDYTLRINLEDFESMHRFAVYKSFKVSSEETHYQLQFGEYTGNAGDSLSGSKHPEVQGWASHQGMKFSTRDRDNDQYQRSCATEDKSGWWFNRCHSANLNGLYYKGPYSAVTDNGIVWYTWHGWWYSYKAVQMKIRPSNFKPNEV